MYRGIYQFAGRNVEICSICHSIHAMCQDYRAEGVLDFSVSTDQGDIALEREKSAREDELEGIPTRRFSDAYLETLAVYRKIAEKMPDYDTLLCHGSAIAVDGVGYLFTAKSGTGKSTHTRLWRELFGERAVMVNDDKPLLKAAENHVTVYGTPWDGKHHLSNNISVPLKAVCILTRSETNRMERISPKTAWPMLMQQTYRPSDPVQLAKTLALVDRLSQTVELYRLGCNMDLEAAQVAYNGMNERNDGS